MIAVVVELFEFSKGVLLGIFIATVLWIGLIVQLCKFVEVCNQRAKYWEHEALEAEKALNGNPIRNSNPYQ